MTDPLRSLSLFSGVGMIDLGLERAGIARTVAQAEQDPWCRESVVVSLAKKIDSKGLARLKCLAKISPVDGAGPETRRDDDGDDAARV